MWPSGPQDNPTTSTGSSQHLEDHTHSPQDHHNHHNYNTFQGIDESIHHNNHTNSAQTNQVYPDLSSSPSHQYPGLSSTYNDQEQEQENILANSSAIHFPEVKDTINPLPPISSSGYSAISSNGSIDSLTLIARVSIPKSHHTQFVEALSSPPDPTLKIKKSVRFISPSTDSTAQLTSSRRERSISGEPISPSQNLFNNNYLDRSKLHQLSIAEKDPEEKMSELMELKQMKIRQEDFLHVKEQIYQITSSLEEKQGILDEVKSERKSLQSELSRYILMVKQIQKDYELIQQAEAELTKDRDQLSQQLTQLRDRDFNFLKEEVDQLRAKKGLRPLPSLEQEEAENLGRYLEKRREHWREDGAQDSSSSVDNTNISSRALGSSSGSRPLRTSASSSSIGSSSVSAISTGRDRGRPGKNHLHSNSGHSRTSSSSGKSKYDSSSRSSRQSQSRSQSPSRPSSSSSTNLRAERLKKRSRY